MRLRALYLPAAAGAASLVALAGSAASSAAVVPPLPPIPSAPAPLSSVLGDDSSSAASPQGEPAAAQSQSVSFGQAAATTSVASQLQRLVTAQINVVRREHGRARLSVSTQLTRAGQAHARELALAGYFSHDWSDGSPFGSWIKRFYPVAGARAWSAGENLAWSTPDVTARQTVEMWLASPEHRQILLSKSWRQVGLGVIRADGAGGVYGGQSVVILAAEFGLRR